MARELLDAWRAEESSAATRPKQTHHPLVVMHVIDFLRGSNPEQHGVILADIAGRFGHEDDQLDDIVRKEQQRLAADQVSIGNIVTSMQLLNGLDWKRFFEHVSRVEQVLRKDPAGVYEYLEFASRDQYRHVVETLARRCRFDEIGVATAAVSLSAEADRQEASDVRRRHVGYFLLDDGRLELEKRLSYRPRLGETLSRIARRRRPLVYLSAIGLLTVAIAAGLALTAAAVLRPPGSPFWLDSSHWFPPATWLLES